MPFVNTPYRFEIKVSGSHADPAPDLTTASSLEIEFEGPQSGSWSAVAIYNPANKQSTVLYEIGAATITVAGNYEFQVVAVINGIIRRSDIMQKRFLDTL